MNKMKQLMSLLCVGTLCVSVAAAAGCSKVSNDPQTLQIYVGEFGYGTEWLANIVADFKEEDWVKAKYPDLSIPALQSNSEKSYAADQITSGKTSIDLFFTTLSATNSLASMGVDGKSYFEELTDLYEMTVPGEQGTVASKMEKTFLDNYKVNVGGKQGYYALPWAQGSWGLFYNQNSVKNKLGENYTLPRTTDELKQMCEDLKVGADGVTPFIFSAKEDYEHYLANIWWAQYEGYDSYERYWLGQDRNETYSSTIFSQQGRLEALTVLEELIGNESGNSHKDVNVLDFTQSQAALIQGTEGVMQTNGDWVQREMGTISSDEQLNRIALMKTPVISNIVKTLKDTQMSDATLAAVVDAVDRGETSYASVDPADFAKIKEARSMVNLIGGHDALIPSYSTAKELAKDFLAYMVSDKSLNTYMRTTKGCKMPYRYDVETADPELYASFTDMQKTKLNMLKDCTVMPFSELYELNYIGQVRDFNTYDNLTFCFTASAARDYHTAPEVFNADIEYYTKANGAEWQRVLQRLGV